MGADIGRAAKQHVEKVFEEANRQASRQSTPEAQVAAFEKVLKKGGMSMDSATRQKILKAQGGR